MVSESYVERCMKKMQEWMELRALAPITLSVYTRCARRFIEHVGKPLGAVKTPGTSSSTFSSWRARSAARAPATSIWRPSAVRFARPCAEIRPRGCRGPRWSGARQRS
jgi:hypothetical protein